MKLISITLACMALVSAAPAMAEGDAAAGEAKAGLCASCHGIDGNSTVSMWPKIAGQHAAYLERQLRLIKSGARQVPEMMGITDMLSDEDIVNLSAYFADGAMSAGVAEPAMISLGERIYRAGNAETDVPACMACHGPAGEGNPLSGYPALAGQHTVYTGNMLSRFRSGQSFGEEDAPSEVMTGVAARMTDEEIQAVASYIQGLYSRGSE